MSPLLRRFFPLIGIFFWLSPALAGDVGPSQSQRFACKVVSSAGVNIREAEDYVEDGSWFTIQWFKASQLDERTIVKSHIESDLGSGRTEAYLKVSPSRTTVERDAQQEWRSALLDIEQDSPLGHYERNGRMVSLFARKLIPAQSGFKKDRSVSVGIAGPGVYIWVGTCNPSD